MRRRLKLGLWLGPAEAGPGGGGCRLWRSGGGRFLVHAVREVGPGGLTGRGAGLPRRGAALPRGRLAQAALQRGELLGQFDAARAEVLAQRPRLVQLPQQLPVRPLPLREGPHGLPEAAFALVGVLPGPE
ncbi:hypothetical protein C2142_26305 [Streptomyces sp. CB01881]|nr:hypothetical protein C2142_26305 [Streptomyces sp. CB01881]